MARIPADQRRQDFIEAAVRVVAEHGVHGATTRRIAEEAGAPLATLHYCFHTKEQLFFAVFQYLAEETSGGVTDESAPQGLAKTAVNWLVHTADWTIAHDDYARAQFDLYFWALRQAREDGNLGADAYQLFYNRIERQLNAALLPGDDPSLVNPLARVLLGIVDGMVMQWIGRDDPEHFRNELQVAADMVETLVRSREKAPI